MCPAHRGHRVWMAERGAACNDDANHDGANACRPRAGITDAAEGLLALIASQANARVVRDVRQTHPIFRFELGCT